MICRSSGYRWEPPQIAQGRVAGAEIVDRYLDAHALQRLQGHDVVSALRISTDSVISSSRHCGSMPVSASNWATVCTRPGCQNCTAETFTAIVNPACRHHARLGLAACVLQHPGADFGDQAGLVGKRNEIVRLQQAISGWRQRTSASTPVSAPVMTLKLAGTRAAVPPAPRLCAARSRAPIAHLPPRPFHARKTGSCRPQALRRNIAVSAFISSSDTSSPSRGDATMPMLTEIWNSSAPSANGLMKACLICSAAARACGRRRRCREIPRTHRCRIWRPSLPGHAFLQALGDLADQRIPDFVAKAIVDAQEPVDIQKIDGGRLSFGLQQLAADVIAEQIALGNPVRLS